MSCLFKQEMDAKKCPSKQACYQKHDSGEREQEVRERNLIFQIPNKLPIHE